MFYCINDILSEKVRIVKVRKKAKIRNRYIEDIYFFEVNTKYISSSAVKKLVFFTSANADIFTARDVIYFVFAVKK